MGEKRDNSTNQELNPDQKKQLLKITRKTLEVFLEDKKIPELVVDDFGLNQKCGVFVTLRKDDSLRGCIGQFQSNDPLYKTVQQTAIDAALHDDRFFPVTASELNSIKIEISVLSKPKKISNWGEIELGKHGVIVRKGLRGGTYLPQVATETGWNLGEFLSHLCCDKAYLPADAYKDPQTKLWTYTAQVFKEE